MRPALILRSFLPFAMRFMYRHPKKFTCLKQHWFDYIGRFEKIAELTGAGKERVQAVFYELECEEALFQELDGLSGLPMHPIVYYGLVRLMKPDVILETGVCDGLSSRFILLAMQRNGHGVLHSIDLPNQDVDLGNGARQRDVMSVERQTGWLVPSSLRARWHLHLGDAKKLLPEFLRKLEKIDISFMTACIRTIICSWNTDLPGRISDPEGCCCQMTSIGTAPLRILQENKTARPSCLIIA